MESQFGVMMCLGIKLLKTISICTICICLSHGLQAQEWSKPKMFWEAGIELHQNFFNGDIYSSLGGGRPGLGVTFARRFHSRISIESSISHGVILANRSKTQSLSTVNYRTGITEFTLSLKRYFYENRGTYLKRPDYNPFLAIGVANQLMYSAFTNSNQLRLLIPVVPLSLGISIKKNKFHNFHFQFDYILYTSDRPDFIIQQGWDKLLRFKIGYTEILHHKMRKAYVDLDRSFR